MNTSLSIRLNVHETLPRHLRNWQIQSGRATFVIDNEMEFDVVSFVEDDSDQWWFIDLRFLFAQAPPITVGSRFFLHLKQQADFVLKEKGLGGLFDFLHNFILTHKITVLRSQAAALARSDWAGSLKVEPVHRELVVQYWTDRPGKKNWIEIGTSSNKPRKGKTSWRGAPISSLTARWFRQGKEVVDVDLGFDWTDLSMERILKRVLALHTGHILRSTRESFNSKLAVRAGLSETEPIDCSLQATLGPTANSLTLSLEPVTGSYILQPATALSARAEYAMNQGREPAQIANIITQLLAQTLRDLVQRHAQQLGWQPVARQSLHLDVIKAAVKLDVLQYALYWPRGWTSKWALAVVIDATGESWWILEIGASGSTVEYAEQIKMERPDGNVLAINRSTLASLERVAVQLLSFRITSRQLEKEAKTYSLRHEISQSNSADAPRIVQGWALYLQTSDLLVTKSGEELWLEPSIAIACEGIKPDGRNVWHIASGRMGQATAADMQKLMAASPQTNFNFTEDGCFRILLSTPFGTDILGELRARLRDVDRLRSFATTLQKRQMRLGSSSLQKVQFQYGPAPHIAAVNFSAEKEIAIELSPNNPHRRVHNLLTEIANERNPSLPDMYQDDANGLDRFCTTLLLTRSLLTALHELETTNALRNPAIHTHSIFKYRLTYTNPLCTFDIRLHPKHDKVFWLIEDNIKRAPDLRPSPERHPAHRRIEALQAKLKELFKSKGPRWFGTRNGIVAELDAVPDALRKLHAAVISCEMPGGYKAPPPLEVQAQGPAQSQQQQQQQASQAQTRAPPLPQAQQGRPTQISPTMPRRQPPPTGLNMVRGTAPRMLQMPPQGLSQAQMHAMQQQQQQQQQLQGRQHGNQQGQGQGKPQVIEID
jgi:mediator of RNA polymerase II transcription subunit 14